MLWQLITAIYLTIKERLGRNSDSEQNTNLQVNCKTTQMPKRT